MAIIKNLFDFDGGLSETMAMIRRNSSIFFSLFVATLMFTLYFYTYPLNVGAYDYPNYLSMIHKDQSNLIHASGYTKVMRTFLDFLGIKNETNNVFDSNWLWRLQMLQLGLCLGFVYLNTYMCRLAFDKIAASAMCLIISTNILFLSGQDQAAPEWLEGYLILLSFLLAFLARKKSGLKKVALYVITFVIIGCAYLVKYNALIILPVFFLIIFYENIRACFKLVIIGFSVIGFGLIVVSYSTFFHYPSTGTKKLSLDHAWVLTASLPENYLSSDPKDLGINSLRWVALSSVLPPDYSRAAAYQRVDWGAPTEMREKYMVEYDRFVDMSREEILSYVLNNPLPKGFSPANSAIPIYYYIGLSIADELGISVFKEAIFSRPVYFINKIYRTFEQVILKPIAPIFPLENAPKGLNFTGVNRFVLSYNTGHITPYFASYWNPDLSIWKPGITFFSFLKIFSVPNWLAALFFVFSCVAVFRSQERDRITACAALLISIFLFISASGILLGVRSKEMIALLPVLALFFGMGISSIVRWYKLYYIKFIG